MASLRRNPLLGTTIIVSPERMKRVWSGATETIEEPTLLAYDTRCPLCPSNTRLSGLRNPPYKGAWSFENDTSALSAPTYPRGIDPRTGHPLFAESRAEGICEVLCYHPDHSKNMLRMSVEEIRSVVSLWADRTNEMKRQGLTYVAIFTTYGEMLGNSMPHPHGQLWASSHIPPTPKTMLDNQWAYFEQHEQVLLLEYAKQEIGRGERVVMENKNFLAVVPYWAEWPYEIMILPKRHVTHVASFSDVERYDLARMLSDCIRTYAALFALPKLGAPHYLALYQAPIAGDSYPSSQLFVTLSTPLLTATRKKHPAGYEQYFGRQSDVTPEASALTLRTTAQEVLK